jgi:hypothetical protein
MPLWAVKLGAAFLVKKGARQAGFYIRVPWFLLTSSRLAIIIEKS